MQGYTGYESGIEQYVEKCHAICVHLQHVLPRTHKAHFLLGAFEMLVDTKAIPSLKALYLLRQHAALLDDTKSPLVIELRKTIELLFVAIKQHREKSQ